MENLSPQGGNENKTKGKGYKSTSLEEVNLKQKATILRRISNSIEIDTLQSWFSSSVQVT